MLTIDLQPSIVCLCDDSKAIIPDGVNWIVGTPPEVALTLRGLPHGQARQSDKIDLGDIHIPGFILSLHIEVGEDRRTDGYVQYYWAPSTSPQRAKGNIKGMCGADAMIAKGAYREAIKYCALLASVYAWKDQASITMRIPKDFSPVTRYGQLLVYNHSGAAFPADMPATHHVIHARDFGTDWADID